MIRVFRSTKFTHPIKWPIFCRFSTIIDWGSISRLAHTKQKNQFQFCPNSNLFICLIEFFPGYFILINWKKNFQFQLTRIDKFCGISVYFLCSKLTLSFSRLSFWLKFGHLIIFICICCGFWHDIIELIFSFPWTGITYRWVVALIKLGTEFWRCQLQG